MSNTFSHHVPKRLFLFYILGIFISSLVHCIDKKGRHFTHLCRTQYWNAIHIHIIMSTAMLYTHGHSFKCPARIKTSRDEVIT